ncbi:MAG: DUF3108 domain-containing protein [Syntrophales bacterium]
MSINGTICHKIMLLASKERCLSIGSKSMILSLILIMFLPSSLIQGSARVIDKNIPFYPGERLTYEGKWGIIPAGEVTLEVLPKETINGVETYHFAMITKTNAAVDLLYKIRERQDSYVDAGMTRSVLYKKRTESKHPRDVVINFNWEKLEATYTNFGKNAAPVHILPGSFDPLALFFILRLQNLTENAVIEIPITDGNMNVRVKATIGKKDIIEIKGKAYKSVAVTPDMEQLGNIVKKSENPQLKIWFSADEKKIPLKIQSKVGIVSFIFEFVSMAP